MDALKNALKSTCRRDSRQDVAASSPPPTLESVTARVNELSRRRALWQRFTKVAPPPDATPPAPKVRVVRPLSTNPAKRIAQELEELTAMPPPGYSDVELVDNNLFHWRAKLRLTDGTLARELQTYAQYHNQDHIVLHVEFPRTYAVDPPFVWMESPRLQLQSGFVSRGAICTEMLTHSGSDFAWRTDYTVEGVFNTILLNFQDPSANGHIDRPQYASVYTRAEASQGRDRFKQLHGWGRR